MAKNLSVSLLMDFYGGLLTDKQKEAVELYYNQDFSLSEIAETMDISRQGARDFIKRGENQLIEFENILGLYKRFSEICYEFSGITEELSKLDGMQLSQAATEHISNIKQIIKRIENNL